MPKNCSTCLHHHLHYDGVGFDGCTCGNPSAPRDMHLNCVNINFLVDENKDIDCPQYSAQPLRAVDGGDAGESEGDGE